MKTKSKLSSMLQCSLFAALLCVLSPLTIPVGAVPVSLGIFAVLLCSSVLGMRRSLVAVLVYIALGAVGLPVFAGWQGGFGVLAGPTGGYIWSYIPVSRPALPEKAQTARVFRLVWSALLLVWL